MLIEVFIQRLENGKKVKVSIWERKIKGKTCFYARVAEITPVYHNLPEHAKATYFGSNASNGNHSKVFYNNHYNLKEELVASIGAGCNLILPE